MGLRHHLSSSFLRHHNRVNEHGWVEAIDSASADAGMSLSMLVSAADRTAYLAEPGFDRVGMAEPPSGSAQ